MHSDVDMCGSSAAAELLSFGLWCGSDDVEERDRGVLQGRYGVDKM